MRSRMRNRLGPLRQGSMSTLVLALGTALLAGTASAGVPEQVTNIFKPLSTPAELISEVAWLALAVCAGIFLVVGGLLAYTTVRFRRRAQDDGAEPPQIYGSNQLELAWTVIPVLIVLVLVLVTARTIADVQNRPAPPDALHVTVVGHQWWWEVRYPALGLVTANELHVPVSTASRRQLAATPKCEVKRPGTSAHSNNCMAVPLSGYSTSNFAGAAN
jgi:cytochrome c oxidase subunit 2